ncbi:hypothetical protein LEL_05349 [Akanthomyces lecanii RCEF 1005]|uniref:Heat-labile enterotoxin IIA, A chain n=1 Tax=Akanthomyces lecanii RCEF 1005 TaxID=1081108 RepID=A0A168HZL7_CORDF|nr:hypothetical protein LEL_05349 [Akanthomyces lecanii RCEF 1005]
MKVAWLALLAVAGTTLAGPTADLQARTPPQAGSAQARELYNLVMKGMQSWGLAGAVHAPGGHPGGPSANLPGGLPELNRPHPPKQDGVPGTPGNPLGPRKKQGRIYPRGKSCTATKRKRGMQCPAGTAATGRTSRYPKLRLNGQGGVMVAFATLAPHAHGILAAVKGWDNPIGAAVAWFDGAMADLQEAIGGKRVPEIDGNELKLWLICLFRWNSPASPDAVDRACQRRRDAPLEERKQQQAIDGLNQVAELCEKVEETPPADGELKTEVLALCDKFADTLEGMADANAALVLLGEWARARTLNSQDLDQSDRAAVAGFIRQGAFGPAAAATEDEAGELASLYLAHMSTYAVVEVEDDGSEVLIDHSRPPAWLELLQMGAGYVPEDRAAVDEALRMLEGTPHLRHVDKEGREGPMARVQTCWDHAGLLLFQPRRWDLVAAAVTYLEGRIRDAGSDLACAPCLTPEGFWVLRCGSAAP